MSASPYHRIAKPPIERRGPGPARAEVYTGRVKSRVVVALVALAAVLLPGRMAAAEDPVAALSLIRPKPVKDAPDFQVRTPDDRQIHLTDLRGKVVFLNFWATWCEPCREEMPSIERLRKAMEGKPFTVLAVNVGEGRPAAANYAAKIQAGFTYLLDRDLQANRAWGARVLPATYLIGPDGAVRYSHFGALDWSRDDIRAIIAKMIE